MQFIAFQSNDASLSVYIRITRMLIKNAGGLGPRDSESINLGNLFESRVPIEKYYFRASLSRCVRAVILRGDS